MTLCSLRSKQVADAISLGKDYIPLLNGAEFTENQLGELLEWVANAFFNERLGNDTAKTALKVLQDHGAPVTDCLDNAMKKRQLHIFQALVDNLNVGDEVMAELFEDVVRSCDPDGDDIDVIAGMIKCLFNNA